MSTSGKTTLKIRTESTFEGNMKRIIGIIKNITICLIVAVFMVSCIFAAVLQESYKLDPVTQDEIMEVKNV